VREEKMPSSAFDAFVESYLGDPYMAWHDGLDEGSLAALEGEERNDAEKMLLEALGSGDYRPAAGLRVLRSTESVAKLKEQLGDATGRGAVEIALALWEIAEWPPAVNVMIDELKHGAHWGSQIDAANALGKVKGRPEVVEALLGALDDEEGLVRSNAADALIDLLGLRVKQNKTYGGYDLAIDVMSEDEVERKKAVNRLRGLVERKVGKGK
jgi:HEAT repeat protein